MEKMLGVMLDCSRNAVLRPEKVKEYALLIARMGYNTLMLYTEDTYELDGQPYFGHMRGRYTKAELKELDAFCASLGLTLVPCIQTLAHLNSIFKFPQTYGDIHDIDDVLLIGEEKTYRLIDSMFATLSECFTARTVQIGMDEAYLVGLGKYLMKHGYADRFDTINAHLHRVCEIARKYGFSVMIWSDMFCKLALNSGDYYNTGADLEVIRRKADLPDNVTLVYWDYYSTDYDRYVRMLKINQAFGKPVYFAGGAWTWKGLAPDNTFSIQATEPALRACRDCGADGVLMTLWGDDGAECSKFALLPTLYYAAEAARGNPDLTDIKVKFKELTGVEFDSFLLLDRMDRRDQPEGSGQVGNSSKYLLYNDVFTGLVDSLCREGDNAYYASLAKKIRAVPEQDGFGYLFEKYAALCDVLAVKSELGLKTRALYTSGDKAGLKALAEEDYSRAIAAVRAFHKAFQTEWFLENKPHGFDVQDIRLGGLLQRLESCRDRLLKFTAGEIDGIPELEEAVLPADCIPMWSRLVSPNVISHIF